MGNISIAEKLRTAKEVSLKDQEWEQASYQIGCATARQEALRRLEEIEQWLFQHYPRTWHVICARERTLVTRFGEITIRRRLYRDERGQPHFLLDEYLGWQPNQLATPSLQESIVELCAQGTFRPSNRTLENLTAGVLSTTTLYRLVQRTASRAIAQEEADWKAVYERGELLPGAERKVKLLFTEGDGTFIHLQREVQTHYELKQAIGYEGWEKLPGKADRYKLVQKRVYCHAREEIPFWEGVSVEWGRKWDLGYLKQIVIGGDGASWIDSGLGEFQGAVRQLDGFHLARACGQGWEEGAALYQAVRTGETEAARRLLESLVPRAGTGVLRARQYVKRNVEKGRDWRTQSELTGRALGTMESNEDKLVANRMKKRGLSWTIKGALRMNRVIQLTANEEIKPYCLRPEAPVKSVARIPSDLKLRNHGHQKWLEAGLPALQGPHPSRPWVKHLRDLANLNYQLN